MRILTAKNIKSAAKSITKVQYLLARRRLMSSIKTGEKYGLKTVSLPDKPKRITQKSINRLNKLNERQKKYNLIRPRIKSVTIKYYYKDASGKNVEIATQSVKLDIPTRFKTHRIQVKDYESFINAQKRQETIHKLEDIGKLINVSKYDTGMLTKAGASGIEAFKGLLKYKGQSMLGEYSVRMKTQRSELDASIERLKYAIGKNEISEDIREDVDDIIKDYEEARTYYKTDEELDALIEKMERAIVQVDLAINGLTSQPLEERYKADVLQALMKKGSMLNA